MEYMKMNLQLFASGSTQTDGSYPYTLVLTVDNVKNTSGEDYDIVNNTSDVYYTLTLTNSRGWYGSYNYGSDTYTSVTINGVNVFGGVVNYDFRNYNSLTLASGYLRNIKHSNDGSKIISCSASFTSGTGIGNGTVYTNLGLPTIPRASILGDNIADYIDESTTGITIPITKYYSPFYQELIVRVPLVTSSNDDADITVPVYQDVATIENIENGDSLILTTEQLNIIYNATKSEANPTLLLTLITYSDNSKTTQIGSANGKEINFIFTDNANPTFSNFNYKDINTITTTLTGNNSIIIPNYSNVQTEIPSQYRATGNKLATITYYSYQDGTKIQPPTSTTTAITHTLNNYNYGNNLNIVVTDSRGRTKTAKKTLQTVNYSNIPIISNIQTQRNNGVESETYLALNLKLWKGNFGTGQNDITYFGYRFKRPNESWGEQTWYDKTSQFKTLVQDQEIDNIVVTFNDNFKIHLNGTSGGITIGNEYDIQIKVSDGIGTTIFNTGYEVGNIDDGKLLDSYYKSDTGYKYAINGMVDPTLDDGLQFYGKLYQNGVEFTGGGSGLDSLPVGTMIPWLGQTLPNETFLFSHGQELSRIEHSELFSVIGTTFGAGNGTTTFNVPDMSERVPVGYKSGSTEFGVLGKLFGEKTHKLTINEMPIHRHGLQGYWTVSQASRDVQVRSRAKVDTDPVDTDSGNGMATAGGDQAHNNIQPSLVVNFIIKAKKDSYGNAPTNQIVGTYSESPTNVYNCEYVNSIVKEVYSSTETKTNKVYFGKPVYRREIEGTTPTSASIQLQTNVDKMFNQCIMVKRNGIGQYHVADSGMVLNDIHNSPIFVTGNAIEMYILNDNYNGQPFYGWLEYTKTTD